MASIAILLIKRKSHWYTPTVISETRNKDFHVVNTIHVLSFSSFFVIVARKKDGFVVPRKSQRSFVDLADEFDGEGLRLLELSFFVSFGEKKGHCFFADVVVKHLCFALNIVVRDENDAVFVESGAKIKGCRVDNSDVADADVAGLLS